MSDYPTDITLYLAEPRGFCAGVRRAIAIVEDALSRFGAPVYVRHEIVHNKHVINELKQKGAVFVEDFTDIPQGSIVIFSAHGVSRQVAAEATDKGFVCIDATCPLVEKVHQQISKYATQNMEIIVIGKPSHPEIIGTLGQLPKDYPSVHVITSAAEAQELAIAPNKDIGFVTQTTLSVDDTKAIVDILHQRFPSIHGLQKKDICYATTNRQQAIKALAAQCECVLVLGSKNSSNSRQLRDVALKNGANQAFLIDDASEIDWPTLNGLTRIGISAGASAPEYLVEELIESFRRRYNKINIQYVMVAKENVNFKL